MSKIKKKRLGFVLDMTPLVDITFLLLTFFMFTAKFKSSAESQQKVRVIRPTTIADTAKLADKDLCIIKIGVDTVAKDTSYYISMVNTDDVVAYRNALDSILPASMKGDTALFKVDTGLFEPFIRTAQALDPKRKLTFAIDADKDLTYKWVEFAIEKMRKNRVLSFNFVTEKKLNNGSSR